MTERPQPRATTKTSWLSSPPWQDTLTIPPKWFNVYADFLTKNAGAVGQIESALRSLTYIIPGQFRDAEIASESLHSGIQLLSLYHDSLLARAIARLPSNLQPSHPTPHHRYTRFWTQTSPFYKRIALTLQMIQYTEILCEMAAKRRGEKIRWRVIVLLEIVKAVCRVLLLRSTDARPLVTPPLPERDLDLATQEASNRQGSDEGLSYPTRSSPRSAMDGEVDDEIDDIPRALQGWKMPRTGLTLPALPAATDITSYLLGKVLTPEDVKPPKALLHQVSGLGAVAEFLYIIRPVIYALAMQHWCGGGSGEDVSSSHHQQKGRGRRSWWPWLLGLSIEYGARQLAKRNVQHNIAGGLRGLTALEREELRRRGGALGWWAMRGAFYDNVTKSYLEKITSALRNTPLAFIGGSFIGEILEHHMYLWDEYYFSTSSS